LTKFIVFSPYGSPIILVLSASNIFTKFQWGQPCGVTKYRGVVEKFCDFLLISLSLYLTDDIIHDSAIVTLKGE